MDTLWISSTNTADEFLKPTSYELPQLQEKSKGNLGRFRTCDKKATPALWITEK